MSEGMSGLTAKSDDLRRKPSAAKAWLKAIEPTSRIDAEPRWPFADFVEDRARRQPQRLTLLANRRSFTYAELGTRINQYARWARDLGIRAGNTLCLMMPNRPDYIACWLGISSLGGTAALVNTRLVGLSLAHRIETVRCSCRQG
ncbi:AMP-binding protein [Bradyrhizobium jicamae]|uniref:AMP-binding protein n=1 Tax=Bradyrhizobium jicamae TaxID=280332 RepID=UPI001BACA62C|nr:AMP-binding protein [Bradyrhizobium jicamae]MBR0938557.1 AMP-binding protein [Bradyrhizobium jicamae]